VGRGTDIVDTAVNGQTGARVRSDPALQAHVGWETLRVAQRVGDAARLADAGALALTSALHLAGLLGPYLVGETVVCHRLQAALHHARRPVSAG
jgi:hypothetical protein